MGYEILGEAERRAGPGDSVTFAPGVAHRFWNAGDEELVCTGFARPTTSTPSSPSSIARCGATEVSARGAFDGAYLSRRYRNEFETLAVPRPVRRFLFPVIVAAGRVLGRHRRFAGAAEPVRRGASDPG